MAPLYTTSPTCSPWQPCCSTCEAIGTIENRAENGFRCGACETLWQGAELIQRIPHEAAQKAKALERG